MNKAWQLLMTGAVVCTLAARAEAGPLAEAQADAWVYVSFVVTDPGTGKVLSNSLLQVADNGGSISSTGSGNGLHYTDHGGFPFGQGSSYGATGLQAVAYASLDHPGTSMASVDVNLNSLTLTNLSGRPISVFGDFAFAADLYDFASVAAKHRQSASFNASLDGPYVSDRHACYITPQGVSNGGGFADNDVFSNGSSVYCDVSAADSSDGYPIFNLAAHQSVGTAGFSAEATAIVSDTPEPASLALFGLGVLGLAAARRRRSG